MPNESKLSDRGWPRKTWIAEKTRRPASVRWSALLGRANSQSNCNVASLPSAGGGGEVAMKKYRQLRADERVQIATLRYQNFSLPGSLESSGGTAARCGAKCSATAPPTTAATVAPAPTSVPWPGANVPGATNSLAAHRWRVSRRCYASSGVLNRSPGTCGGVANFLSATRRSTGTSGVTWRRGGGLHLQTARRAQATA